MWERDVSLIDWVGTAAALPLFIAAGALVLLWGKMSGGQSCSKHMRICSTCSLALPAATKRCAYCGHTHADALGRKLLTGLAGLLLIAGMSVFGDAFLVAWIQAAPSQLPSLHAWVSQFPSVLPPSPHLVLADVPRSAAFMPPLMEMYETEALKMPPPSTIPPTALVKPSVETLSEQNEATTPVSAAMVSPSLSALNPFVSRVQALPSAEQGQTAGAHAEIDMPMVMTCGGPVPASRPEPDFTAYLSQLQRQIRQHWAPPNMDRDKRVVIAYRVSCDGELLQARILESSGISAADQAGLTAVKQAAPFPPLPADYRGQAVEVQFAFDYGMRTRTMANEKK
jgi:TonB family protein